MWKEIAGKIKVQETKKNVDNKRMMEHEGEEEYKRRRVLPGVCRLPGVGLSLSGGYPLFVCVCVRESMQ
jgi:hypothetical protein